MQPTILYLWPHSISLKKVFYSGNNYIVICSFSKLIFLTKSFLVRLFNFKYPSLTPPLAPINSFLYDLQYSVTQYLLSVINIHKNVSFQYTNICQSKSMDSSLKLKCLTRSHIKTSHTTGTLIIKI